MEARAEHHGLDRKRPPGFDHPQPFLELWGRPKLYAQDVRVYERRVNLATDNHPHGVQVRSGAARPAEKTAVLTHLRKPLQNVVVAAQGARVVVGPRAVPKVEERPSGAVGAHHELGEVDRLPWRPVVPEHW